MKCSRTVLTCFLLTVPSGKSNYYGKQGRCKKNPDLNSQRTGKEGTRVQIIYRRTGLCGTEGFYVSFRQVNHVYVISYSRSVRGGVVLAEYGNSFCFSLCHADNTGHKVVGNTVGLFADQSAFVCADRVKIPKQRSGKFGVGNANALLY